MYKYSRTEVAGERGARLGFAVSTEDGVCANGQNLERAGWWRRVAVDRGQGVSAHDRALGLLATRVLGVGDEHADTGQTRVHGAPGKQT